MLSLREVKQQISSLRPNDRLGYLREQIAGREILLAEVRQLREERDARRERVEAGELPRYSLHDLDNQISARMNTVNRDYELAAVNAVCSQPDGRELYNHLLYDCRNARDALAKQREVLKVFRNDLTLRIERHEREMASRKNVVRSGPWVPEWQREDLQQERATIQAFENDRHALERQIRDAEASCKMLSQEEFEARSHLNLFKHWVYTGSLEMPKPSAVTA